MSAWFVLLAWVALGAVVAVVFGGMVTKQRIKKR